MRHLKKGRKFGRVRKTRVALIKSLVRSLVRHGRIKTTLPRAKEARMTAEKLVTKAKEGGLANRRHIGTYLTKEQVKKIFEIASAMKDRKGGYTRITRIQNRKGDAAEIAILEFMK